MAENSKMSKYEGSVFDVIVLGKLKHKYQIVNNEKKVKIVGRSYDLKGDCERDMMERKKQLNAGFIKANHEK